MKQVVVNEDLGIKDVLNEDLVGLGFQKNVLGHSLFDAKSFIFC